jgi:hypothetical protein
MVIKLDVARGAAQLERINANRRQRKMKVRSFIKGRYINFDSGIDDRVGDNKSSIIEFTGMAFRNKSQPESFVKLKAHLIIA